MAVSPPNAFRVFWIFTQRLKAYRGWALLGIGLSLLAALSGIALLGLSGWFISASALAGLSITTGLAFNFFMPATGVRFFALVRIVGRYLERVVTHEVTFRALADLRVWFYQRLEPLAPGILLRFRHGDLLNRLLKDIESLDNLYIRVLLPSLVIAGIWGVLACILPCFNTSISVMVLGLLLLAIGVVPLLALRYGKHRGQALAEAFSDFRSQWMIESPFLSEDVGARRLERLPFMVQRGHEHLAKYQREMSILEGVTQALMLVLAGCALVLTLWVSIPLLAQHQLMGANLALLALVVLGGFEGVNLLPSAYQYLGQTLASGKRVLEIVDQAPEIVFPQKSSAALGEASLLIQNLCFGYDPALPLFKNFSLDIPSGEKVALLGPTGVGKSALLHILTRFVTPLSGKILLGQIELAQCSEADLRSAMTVVSQTPYLFSETLAYNLRLGKPTATDAELWEVLAQVQLKTLVQEMPEGLKTWVGIGGREFSGGELKRFALARALLHNAPIWLLDEPMEGLDSVTRQALLAMLAQALQQKTVVWITHQIMDLEPMHITRVVTL